MGNEVKTAGLVLALLIGGCASTPASTQTSDPAPGPSLCESKITHPDGTKSSGKMTHQGGQLTQEIWILTHPDGHTITDTIAHVYEGSDRVGTARAVDGYPIETISYTYQEHVVTKIERDIWAEGLPGVDGEPDQITTYSTEGDVRVESTDSADGHGPPDGTVDSITRKTLQDGRVVSESTVMGEDEVERAEFHYNEAMQLETKNVFFSGSPDPDAITSYSYDEDGRLIKEVESSALGETVTQHTYCR